MYAEQDNGGKRGKPLDLCLFNGIILYCPEKGEKPLNNLRFCMESQRISLTHVN